MKSMKAKRLAIGLILMVCMALWITSLASAESVDDAQRHTIQDSSAISQSGGGSKNRSSQSASKSAAQTESVASVSSDGGTLKRGSQGARVRQAQEKLSELGFYTDGVDGSFGQKTQQAVEAYQRANQLAQTGTLTEAEFDALMLKQANSASDGTALPNESAPVRNLVQNLRTEEKTFPMGITYQPLEDGRFALSGSSTGRNVISLNPLDLVPAEDIPALPTLFTLRKGCSYLVSGVQLVCLHSNGEEGFVFVSACVSGNWTVDHALLYTPQEDLPVKEVRVWFNEGGAGVGTYEPAVYELPVAYTYMPYGEQ